MKKSILFTTAMLLLVTEFMQNNAYATKHIISVQNFSFSPASIPDVIVGDTVRWVWVSGTHTTTSTTIPAAAATWDSPISSTHTSYEYAVTTAGTYNYKCTPHASMGMTGSFIASAPAATLAVMPSNQNVAADAGSTSFDVTSNSAWTSSTDRDWCTATASGTGNGTINVNYEANPTNAIRVATITVSVSGLDPMMVTVTQDMSSVSVTEIPGSSFLIYPNPTQGNFYVSLGNQNNKSTEITVIDAIGKVVRSERASSSDKIPFNLSTLKRGAYYIRIVSDEGIKVSKLMLID
jgi:plastocyanin